MTYQLIHGDARRVSDVLEPASVDLIVTSPPYWQKRSYRDAGQHYSGQLGSENTPAEWTDNLIECTRDWISVLKPGGSMFVNLGDGYDDKRQQGLPWRYAIRCIDELGLILRADMVWHKPNGLPESVTDRVRQNHEYWFHLTREPRYFAAVDEIREPHDDKAGPPSRFGNITVSGESRTDGVARPQTFNPAVREYNPLGKLPGSVWTIPSEPLTVPAGLGVDHFAAFPSEWPRRLILGWSPSGWCTACGEARRSVVEKALNIRNATNWGAKFDGTRAAHMHNRMGTDEPAGSTVATILGYRCACPDTTAPTRPAVILDPFAGTGTTVAVAHHLGRHGIGIDLSRDYLRLAEWRCTSDTRLRDKILDRSDLPAAPKIDGQLSLEDLL